MIRCQECNADNMVGAIFCRSCGSKLNLDEIRPETENQRSESFFGNLNKIAGKLAGVLVLLVLLALLGAMLVPTPGKSEGVLDDTELEEAMKRYEKLLAHTGGRQRTEEFDSETVTAIANSVLGLTEGSFGGGGQLVPEHLSIELLSSGYVKLVLRARLFGKVPVHSTLIGNFTVEDGGVQFEMSSASAGKIDMVSKLEDIVLKRFAALVEGKSDLDDLRTTIRVLDVGDDSVAITVK